MLKPLPNPSKSFYTNIARNAVDFMERTGLIYDDLKPKDKARLIEHIRILQANAFRDGVFRMRDQTI